MEMTTVRDVMERINEIDYIRDEIRRDSKDLDMELILDILNEYREALFNRQVK
jgi:hypothetical protein